MTDLELADAVLDALTQDYAGLGSAEGMWERQYNKPARVPTPSSEARVRLEALFRDLRARGAL